MTPDQFDYIRDQFAAVKNDIAKVARHVDGGSEPSSGLNMRVRMLETDAERTKEVAKNAKGLAWGAAGSVVAAGVTWLASRFSGHS